ncbi:periplasmic divalent cation tolerance protein [Oryzihumus leptocrescens]|uniref:Periplasmic divalent cation tolerance protein n=1 Tax=Oryzihumus leptocrescens TaxID=297536 RepID=A0A542Z941_9MICO|nr:periplasmic divalent cation tolerance protein [Oryzihumus leptocrescens]
MTVGAPDEADRIAAALVGEGLAACVQVVPGITSVYRWEGLVERSAELLLLAKTTDELFDRLAARVVELHSYDTPEVLAVPVVRASEGYAVWLRESVVRA